MCGIWAYFMADTKSANTRANPYRDHSVTTGLQEEEMYKLFMKLKHRGPNSSSFFNYSNGLHVGFHRLEIMDPTFHSNQPYVLYDGEKTIIFMCNGEIYNYDQINKDFGLDLSHNSDCLTIPLMYIKLNRDFDKFKMQFTEYVKGEFAFLLFELDNSRQVSKIIYARDAIGVRPLYKAGNSDDMIAFSSEVKGLNHPFLTPEEVTPGVVTCLTYSHQGIVTKSQSYTMLSHLFHHRIHYTPYYDLKKEVIQRCVTRRLNAQQPIGFLLSGGVDSSLVAAIASAELRKHNIDTKIRTFCCGFENSPDMLFARKVASYINSNHVEVIFTPEEALSSLKDVIYTTETWDTTTIRASVGQYLVSKYISQNTDIKVLLVGEGPDEVCSSYLFNYYAPSPKDLHDASVEYVEKIHLYDGRRVDRCTSRWGLECRIPFLDPQFIDEYWSLTPERREPKNGGIEKFELRNLFKPDGLLPDEVLWRKKEAFSDGISQKTNSWFSILQNHISQIVTDEEFQKCDPLLASPTKEAYYYKKLFAESFGTRSLNIIPGYWQPKWIDRNGSTPDAYIDPSARVLDVY